ESDELEKNRQFVERLGAKMQAATVRIPVVSDGAKAGSSRLVTWLPEALHTNKKPVETIETNLFVNVFYKGDLPTLGSKALLFESETNLMDLRKTLKDYQPFIGKFTKATNLTSL